MSINIEIDSSKLQAQLNELNQGGQFVFAMSKGLNNLAKIVQKNLQTDMVQSLNVRRISFIRNAIKINKENWSNKYKMSVTINIDRRAEFLNAFEEGQEHLPFEGHNYLTIPNKKVFGRSVISGDNPLRPKNLQLTLQHGLMQGLQRTFLIKDKEGTPLILQRTSPEDNRKKRRGTNRKTGVRLLWTLVKGSMRPKKIHWYETATMTVENEQAPIFWFTLQEAIMKAKH